MSVTHAMPKGEVFEIAKLPAKVMTAGYTFEVYRELVALVGKRQGKRYAFTSQGSGAQCVKRLAAFGAAGLDGAKYDVYSQCDSVDKNARYIWLRPAGEEQ